VPVIACPHCGTRLEAPDDILGQQVVCGRCGRAFAAERLPPAPGPAAIQEAPPSAERKPAPPPVPPPVAGTPGGPPGFAQPVGVGYSQPLKSSGYAVASLVLGIASIPTCFCLGLPSIVCGILAVVFHKNAMRDVEAGVVSPSSAGMAKGGRICGMIGIVLGVGYWVVYIGAIVASTVL